MKYPWARLIAELRRQPGQWRLFPEMTGRPITLINRVRRRQAQALRLPDGRIYARRGAHVAHRDDEVITDVWLCWRPYPTKEADDG
jgi:hypothetical protein